MSRAIDETGYVQPSFAELLAVRGDKSFYHNNAIVPWRVAASGEVTNANRREVLFGVSCSQSLRWHRRRRAGAKRYGIGRPATAAEIAGWNIDIDRDGNKLPPGSGSVVRGREVFEAQCASCHGAKGEGGVGDRLVGGQGTLATPKPVRTVGSYLAVRADTVRLYPPRDAEERAAIAKQR